MVFTDIAAGLARLNLYFSVVAVASCGPTVWECPHKTTTYGSLVLTFDDAHIASWHGAMPVFGSHPVTFFVTSTESLSEERWQLLKELSDGGHEIGAHARRHLSIGEHCGGSSCSADRIQEYIDGNIVPHLQDFADHGLYPTSFAHPGGNDVKQAEGVLLQYFDRLRDTTYGELPHDSAAFADCDGKAVFAGIGMDHSYGHTLVSLGLGMDRAFCDDQPLILYGHRIVDDPSVRLATTPDRLHDLIAMAKERNLPILRFDQACE
jgi:hypothetical protein